MKELYAGHEKAVLMLSDVSNIEECETEDIIGEGVLLAVLKDVAVWKITLNQDIAKGSLRPGQKRRNADEVGLPDG